jgi:hypothetical protein
MSQPMPTPTPTEGLPRRRRRFMISLRSMMILVLVFGGWLGWFVRRVQVRHDAVAAVKNAGGSVVYDLEWRNAGPNPYRKSWVPDWLGGDQTWIPQWILRGSRIDYFGNVVLVSLIPSRVNDPRAANDDILALVARLDRLQDLRLTSSAVSDAGLAHLGGLTDLRDLQIGRTQVGDIGMAHIKTLTSLTSLYIADTQVTDAGLIHLRGLTNLRVLFLAGTKVTDDGVLALERALPNLQVLREEDMSFVEALPRALHELDYARSQPIRLATMLLTKRAESMADRGAIPELAATIDALCGLEPTEKVSLLKLAEGCATCLRCLEGHRNQRLADQARQALQERCANRGIAALARAIDLGLTDVELINERVLPRHSRNIRARNLEPLRDYPAFQRLTDRLKERKPER